VKAKKGKIIEVKLVKVEKDFRFGKDDNFSDKASWNKISGEENSSKLIKNGSEERNLEGEIVFNGERYREVAREEVKATPEKLNDVYQEQKRLKGSNKELIKEFAIGSGIIVLITSAGIWFFRKVF
jgi:hypothetical protein